MIELKEGDVWGKWKATIVCEVVIEAGNEEAAERSTIQALKWADAIDINTVNIENLERI